MRPALSEKLLTKTDAFSAFGQPALRWVAPTMAAVALISEFVAQYLPRYGHFSFLGNNALDYFTVLASIVAVWLVLERQGVDLHRLTTRNDCRHVYVDCALTVALVILSTVTVSYLLSGAIHAIDPELLPKSEESYDHLLRDLDYYWFSVTLALINLIVLTPILEEILFRGVMFARLSHYLGVPLSMVLTAVVFAYFHTNFVGAFIVSIVLSVIFLRSGSLFAPIICHLIHNLIVMTVGLWSGNQPYLDGRSWIPFDMLALIETPGQYWSIVALLAAALGIALISLRLLRYELFRLRDSQA